MVVPGRAEVVVQIPTGDAARVNIRPVFWRAGVAGAPTGDDAPRVEGSTNVYAGQIWLMSRGSYSVYVTVNGARGSGTAIVPVAVVRDRTTRSYRRDSRRFSSRSGGVLFVGLVTIVRAATGEALLEPGAANDETRHVVARASQRSSRRRFSALLVFGGASGGARSTADYERTMYRPPAVDAKVERADGGYALNLRVHDTAAFHAIFAPVIPDHGKMMHLFVVSEGSPYFFGHFHPTETDSLHFREVLTGIADRANTQLFGDIVLANGLSQTVTATSIGRWTAARPHRKTRTTRPGETTQRRRRRDASRYDWRWTLDCRGRVDPNRSSPNDAADLRFEVRDGRAPLCMLPPYIGMAAHAVVLSPTNRCSFTCIRWAPSRRPRSRPSPRAIAATRPRPERLLAADTMSMAMPISMDGHLDFPYEFPKSGRYRVWVQVRPAAGARVLTGAFDLDVR